MKKPLHFKYYTDSDDSQSLTEETADQILGKESFQITKNKVNLKYDHSDPGWNVNPAKPVDYSKSQLDMETLMEPLSPTEENKS